MVIWSLWITGKASAAFDCGSTAGTPICEVAQGLGTSTQDATVNNVLTGGVSPVYVPSGPGRQYYLDTETGIFKAADDAEVTPGLGMAGSIIQGVAAFAIGWQVGSAIDHWLPMSAWVGGTPGTVYNYPSAQWTEASCTGNGTGTFTNSMTPHQSVFGHGPSWACALAQQAYGLPMGSPAFRVWWLAGNRAGNYGYLDDQTICAPPGGGSSQDCELQALFQATLPTDANAQEVEGTGAFANAQSGTWGVLETPFGIQSHSAPTGPISTTNPGLTTTQSPAPIVPSNATAVEGAQSMVGDMLTDHPGAGNFTDCQLDSSYCSGGANDPNPVVLLRPLINETYDTYVSRLQAEGWLGTATEVQEASVLPGYGPLSVTRIQDGSIVYDPLNWPSSSPSLDIYENITVRYNPDSATPAPTVSSPSPQCGSTSATACQIEDISTGPDNNVGTIDWTPLESLDLGSKFPFGVASYINSFFGAIPTSGTCPDLSINKPSALGGGTLSVSFCNTAWETTYRPTVFLVLEALMTLAGVIFLAQKITGVGSTDE